MWTGDNGRFHRCTELPVVANEIFPPKFESNQQYVKSDSTLYVPGAKQIVVEFSKFGMLELTCRAVFEFFFKFLHEFVELLENF